LKKPRARRPWKLCLNPAASIQTWPSFSSLISQATRGEIFAIPVRIVGLASFRRLGFLTSTLIRLALTHELECGIGDEGQYDYQDYYHKRIHVGHEATSTESFGVRFDYTTQVLLATWLMASRPALPGVILVTNSARRLIFLTGCSSPR
jgi:hypothetical protein